MDKRPVNLNFFTMQFPITAWVSILHRLSGLVLFLFIPYLLWILNSSLFSAESFQALYTQFTHPFVTFLLALGFAGLIFHLIAGIRHLLMDNHIGESKQGGKIGAILVFCLSFLVILFIFLKGV
jgi:succinate dehydrogenase / fumarate reductase, cytochrome b subunit